MTETIKRRTIGPDTARKRRKETRPAEIVEAALASFLEFGFEATKLDEVAKRAGVAKGTVYLYFETKEHLFRAVVKQVIASNMSPLWSSISEFEGPFDQLVATVLTGAVTTVATSQVPAMAKLILREAERIPDLARIWFDEVAAPTLAAVQTAIEKAQAKGEVRAGDPRAHMVSIIAPMVLAVLAKEIIGPLGFELVNPADLAKEHRETLMHGMLARGASDTKDKPPLRRLFGKQVAERDD